jgi:dihydroxyacetone kinase-like protein
MAAKVPSASRSAASGRPTADDGHPGIPLRFGDDPYVWACWLYYEDGLTQGEIAEAMGVSRATVNAYLQDARDRGIVNIALDPARLASLTIADELKRHFGLEECLVVPSEETRPLIDRLATAGAMSIRSLVKSGDTLGVVWGRTVMAVAGRLDALSLHDVTVVQATGSTPASFPYTPDLCAAAFAAALGARCINITAPAIVGSPELARTLLAEPLIAGQFATLASANRILFGISTLRPNSTIHASGFFESVSLQHYLARGAVGVLAGRFINERGELVEGPLDARTIGIPLETLSGIRTRVAVAGGFDKVQALLAMLRGGYANVLITDAATGRGILNADGVTSLRRRPETAQRAALTTRTQIKKFLNRPGDAVDEMLEGVLKAHGEYLAPVTGTHRVFIARNGPRPGKVALMIGGGAGHEPCFYGYVGRGLADAVAIGNVFSSPPPDPIVLGSEAASGGAGVLFVYGNYAGDVMNFEMAAEILEGRGIAVRTVLTTDDIASSPVEARDGRRGVAGNVLVFKIAGAACDQGLPLEACEAVTRKANARTYTIGVALEPCSLPQIRRPNFELGPDDLEMGIGIHGEPGVARERLRSADAIVDSVMDHIFTEMRSEPGDRVAVLVNSFGATPMMELYIIYRRVERRLAARGITVVTNWIGPYCTSLDMVGASVTVMHLDRELEGLLAHPCEAAFLKVV